MDDKEKQSFLAKLLRMFKRKEPPAEEKAEGEQPPPPPPKNDPSVPGALNTIQRRKKELEGI